MNISISIDYNYYILNLSRYIIAADGGYEVKAYELQLFDTSLWEYNPCMWRIFDAHKYMAQIYNP